VLVRDHTVELVELEAGRLEDSLVRGPDGEVSALGGYCESLGIARPGAATPLLSYGANAAPEALVRKLAGLDPVVPLVLVRIEGLDAVYSAHISPSGGLGAALQRSQGTTAEMAIAYLGGEALAAIDATEPNYDRVTLPGTDVEAYVSKHGCLVMDGGHVAVAGVGADRRRFPALTTIEAVDAVRERLAPDRSLEEFVVENAAEPQLAAERTAVLRSDARPLAPAAQA
jgi:hypothetical protein